jgi:hypothetical protein
LRDGDVVRASHELAGVRRLYSVDFACVLDTQFAILWEIGAVSSKRIV